MKKQLIIYSFKERVPEHNEVFLVFRRLNSFTMPLKCYVRYPFIKEPNIYKEDYYEIRGVSVDCGYIDKKEDFYILYEDIQSNIDASEYFTGRGVQL